VLAGVGGTLVWQLLAGLLAWSAGSLVLLQLVAAVVAVATSAVLARSGDRGVAVGVAAAAGVALALVLPAVLFLVANPMGFPSPGG
jgi:hypothetical protein